MEIYGNAIIIKNMNCINLDLINRNSAVLLTIRGKACIN